LRQPAAAAISTPWQITATGLLAKEATNSDKHQLQVPATVNGEAILAEEVYVAAISGRGRDVLASNSLWWAFFHFGRTRWMRPRKRPTLATKQRANSPCG
jgi:hypothetical protein